MKTSRGIKKVFSYLFPAFAMGTLLSSCNLYDGEGDCPIIYNVKFLYEMNMSGGDGFPKQVKSVNLWAFNHSTGEFVAEFSDSGEALSKEGYRLDISSLKPGRYDFIAWCGLGEGASFSVPSDIQSIEDLKCRMTTETVGGEVRSDLPLTPLFYGSLNNQELPDEFGEFTYPISLIKDTNNINISLQHRSDEPLTFLDFTIYMKDQNSYLDYDNSLLGSTTVTYYPWFFSSGDIEFPGEDLNYLKAELSTSRLMADQNPIITIIDNDNGNTIYSIPIVEWAKKLRSAQHLSMDDQEYLDRQHEYDLILLLINDGAGWKAESLQINGFDIE